MFQRVLVVANRHSRRGATHLGAALERLRAGGVEPALAEPPRERGRDGIGEAVRALGPAADVVAIGGGDGTMNAAAAALLEVGRPFAVLPLGTANDLARTLGVPQDPAAAAALILEGRTRRIDLGRVNDRYFFNVASVGLSVRVAQALTRDVKRRLGVLSYPVTVYRALKEGRSFSAEVRPDDGGPPLSLRSIQLAVGNGRFYGGGMVVDEGAAIDDHLLHLYSLRPQAAWRLALRALAFRRGRHDDPTAVEALAGTGFEVLTKRPMRVNTDGEVTTSTPARFSVLPGALEAVVPAGT
jgi:diacylglycerol kinase (ATP)